MVQEKTIHHLLTTVHEPPSDPDQLVRGLPARLPDEERVPLPAEDDELNGLAGGPQPRDVVRHAVVHRGVDRGGQGPSPLWLPNFH